MNTDAIDANITKPQVYFTLGQSGYAIVDSSKEAEVDYLRNDGTQARSSYHGSGGVALNSWVKRAAFALRFGDWNPLISSYVTPGSKILYVRDVQQRVQAVAPFLTVGLGSLSGAGRRQDRLHRRRLHDHQPLPERADGRHDQPEPSTGLGSKSFNYVRNSVKAVVDAYNGSVTIYVVDQKDPIIKAYESAFPKLFDQGAPPQDLRDHFRYPEDIFTVQTNMWGRYHITDPQSFYSQTAGWSVAQDPGHDVVNPQQGVSQNQQGQTTVGQGGPGRSVLRDHGAAGAVAAVVPAVPLVRAVLAGRLEEDADRVHGGRERQRRTTGT